MRFLLRYRFGVRQMAAMTYCFVVVGDGDVAAAGCPEAAQMFDGVQGAASPSLVRRRAAAGELIR